MDLPAQDGEEQSSLPLLELPSEGIPPVIDTAEALRRAADRLVKSSNPAAVDTERAQGRTYGSAAYLVQIRKSDVGSFLIDSHALPDLSVLSPALDGEWILHAADQDLACMADLALRPSSLFDTEIAARLLGSEKFGLGALTEEYLGIRLKKNHQNEDWSQRPLPESWLSYAALDVELLPELREVLWARLEQSERTEWALQEFDYELNFPNKPRANHWRNLKGLGRVKHPEQLAVARELWLAREELAKSTDTAPGRVLTGNAIVDASLMNPESKQDLLKIGDFKRPMARKNIDLWWKVTSKALDLPASELPDRPRSDRFSVPVAAQWKRLDSQAFERLEEVREMAQVIADPLGVAPDVVLNAKTQRILAWWPIDHQIPTPENPVPARVKTSPKPAFIDAVSNRLSQAEARPWQVSLIREYMAGTRNPLPKVKEAAPRAQRI